MTLRIGGWTRIWIVLCLVFGAFALNDLRDDLRNARTSANEAYDREVSWQDACAKLTANKAAGTLSKFDALLQEDCSTGQSAAHALTIKDQTLRERQTAAYGRALGNFLWPAGIIGALFLAIGWIRSGFRKRKTS